MKYFFAVDLGATSGRTLLSSFDGNKVDFNEVVEYVDGLFHFQEIKNYLNNTEAKQKITELNNEIINFGQYQFKTNIEEWLKLINKTLHFFPQNSLTYGLKCFKIIEYVRIPAKLPGLYRFN